MLNEDKSVGLVFNGEIYNYLDVKKTLSKEHVWRGKSDTEVLLNGYEAYHYNLFDRIEGMFGMGVYDFRENKLVLARDHFGKKPVYYYHDDETFVFASEIKAFLKNPDIKKKLEIDELSLSKYMFYGYVPSPHSIFKQIKKLEPATYLVFDVSKWQVSEKKRYWKLEDVKIRQDLTEVSIMEKLDFLLDASVKKRLMSDVPLGMFLSGGIDSSLISYYLSKHARDLDTFTVTYREQPNINEAVFARKAAVRFDLRHNFCEFENGLVEDTFMEVINYLDEPMADAAIVPLYFLSKIARKDITVVLSGDGGDEIFGGYTKYRAQSLIERYKFLKRVSGYVEPFFSEDSPYLKFARGFDMPFEQRQFIFGSGSFFETEVSKLLSKDLNMGHVFEDATRYWLEFIQNDPINASLYLDCKIQLPDWYLVKGDRATMANSQEMRNPMLDKALAEFMFSLPGEWKVRRGETKYLAKKLAAKYFDNEFVYRAKKGFAAPMDRWIRQELNEVFTEYLFKDLGYFNLDYVRTLYTDHMEGRFNNQFKLLRIMNFNYFMDRWFL